GGGGLNPACTSAGQTGRGVLSNIDPRPSISAALRQTLNETQADQNDRRDDDDSRVSGQDADQKCAETHQGHGDEKGVLAADQIADPSEDEGAEWTCRKARRKGEQSEDEANGGGQKWQQRYWTQNRPRAA